MMLQDIYLEIRDEELKTYLRKASKFPERSRKALKKSSIIMFQSFAKNFREQGRPRKWSPLSPFTILKRRKGSSRILEDTGRLRMSVISRLAAGNVFSLSSNTLVMGTRLYYAPFLQFGTSKHTKISRSGKKSRKVSYLGVRIPPRPFVLIQEEDVTSMKRIFEEEFIEAK